MCKVDLESGKCTPAEARRGESNEAHKVQCPRYAHVHGGVVALVLEPGPRLVQSPSLWARPEPRQPFFRRYPRGTGRVTHLRPASDAPLHTPPNVTGSNLR
jgi:hypothetical protein